MQIETITPAETDVVIALIAAEQVQLERNIPFLGDDATGIRSELDALEPAWTSTARIAHAADDTIVGVIVVELDESIARAWVMGPWVFGDDDAWREAAPQLLDAAFAQVPAGSEVELSGEVANTRLAALATARGFTTSGVSHVLTINADGIASWPAGTQPLRKATTEDLDAIQPLHDAEFPNTHTPAPRMIAELVTIVATADDGSFLGYAAGKIQPDGEGYIDYVGVDPAARGKGVGKALVSALAPELLAASPKQQVALVVDDDRVAARALYTSLGFTRLASMVGYRRAASA